VPNNAQVKGQLAHESSGETNRDTVPARGRLPLMGGLSQRINAVCVKEEVLLETLRSEVAACPGDEGPSHTSHSAGAEWKNLSLARRHGAATFATRSD
jgi:hypothetical protein